MRHMPQLDALRAVAVSAVVWHHNVSLPFSEAHNTVSDSQAADYGVKLFFTLSGFLITGLLIASRDRSDHLSQSKRTVIGPSKG